MEPHSTLGKIGALIGTVIGSAIGSFLVYGLVSKIVSLMFKKRVSLYVSWLVVGCIIIILTIYLEVKFLHYVFLVLYAIWDYNSVNKKDCLLINRKFHFKDIFRKPN